MEMLVALAIFSVTVGITSDLFLTASRQQSRTSALGRLQTDARYLLETIAREVRDGFVIPAATPSELQIPTVDGGTIRFRRVTVGCPAGVSACIEIERVLAGGSPTERAAITGAGITAEAFDVVASGDLQPFATVRVALSAAGGKPGERLTVEAQTTVVSRVYLR